MQYETNTSSAGAILDYMPQLMREEMINDLIIMPEHEDTKHHGGVRFRLQSNNKNATWEIIHNFNDYFDITLTDETGTVIRDTDIHAGTLINAFVDILDNHFDSITNLLNNELLGSDQINYIEELYSESLDLVNDEQFLKKQNLEEHILKMREEE